jgi:hypothetical protein
MLKYKASDIVKRAKDIADLRGTDFVNDEECLSLINESWVDIYNKLINIGDRSFLTEVELSRGDNYLPDDFYQLNFVVDEFNRPIQRYTVGMLPSEKFYEVVNDHIQINGCNKAFMYYYTEPFTITFPKEDVKITTDVSVGKPVFYDKEKEAIYFANGTYAYKSSNFQTICQGTKGLIPFNETNTIPTVIYVDYEGNQIRTKGTVENKIYIDGENWTITATSEDSKVLYHITDNDWLIWDYSSNSFSTRTYENNTIPNFVGQMTDMDEFIEVVDGHTYLETKDGYYLDGALLEKKSNYSVNYSQGFNRTGVIFSVNFDTGYGAFLNDPLTIKSIFPDTELNFPNNVFYSLLSYQLAFAFCCKQAKDTKYIEAQLANAWETLYNSINRDGFGQSSIINTYRG